MAEESNKELGYWVNMFCDFDSFSFFLKPLPRNGVAFV